MSSKQLFKAILIITDGKFRNNLLVSCRYNAAIVFVLGSINSNKVHGHIDLPPEIIV